MTIGSIIAEPDAGRAFLDGLAAAVRQSCACGCGQPIPLAPGETEFFHRKPWRAGCFWGAASAALDGSSVPGSRVRSACA